MSGISVGNELVHDSIHKVPDSNKSCKRMIPFLFNRFVLNQKKIWTSDSCFLKYSESFTSQNAWIYLTWRLIWEVYLYKQFLETSWERAKLTLSIPHSPPRTRRGRTQMEERLLLLNKVGHHLTRTTLQTLEYVNPWSSTRSGRQWYGKKQWNATNNGPRFYIFIFPLKTVFPAAS